MSSKTDDGMVLPIIDLGADEAAAVQQVYQACTEHGFFYVANHGIDADFMEQVWQQTRALFSLPPDAKAALLADENNRGWTPLAEETLDPANQRQGDTKEGFYFGREIAADSPEAALPLHGPNQWPPQHLLPQLRSTYESYMQRMAALGARVVRLLALSLGLPPDHFDPAFDRPMTFLRPLHYTAQVSSPGDGIFGAGAHSDYGMLTFLATDGTPGLQIHLRGAWLDVPHPPGTFIVNLGDMLERWTNGLFRSTLHRVVNTSGRERYSIPFFFDPNFDAEVECLPCCCAPATDRPAAYARTTAGAHLLEKYATTRAGYDVQQKQQRLQQQQQQQQQQQRAAAAAAAS